MEITDLAFIDSTGYHFSDYPAFLEFIKGKYREIYGADVYLEADSQDGQFLAILAKAFFDTAALGGSVFNSFSPVTAQGVGLSRNVKINGLNRRAATNSTVDLTIVGAAGTQINNGVATDSIEQKWDLPAIVIIPGPGTIIVTGTAQVAGALIAEPGTINKIFTPTLGWQTVNNVSAATTGVPVETDAVLRLRQKVSTANPSLTVFDGTIGALENLTGVTAVRGYENDTSFVDSNLIPAHTISCIVEGGDVTEICQTIQLHKTPGTGTYGDVSEIVFDPHDMPLLISFFRPVLVPITVDITLDVGPGYTSNYSTMIKTAVADFINNIGIGNDVEITKIYVPAYLAGTPAFNTFDITDLQLNGGSVNIDILFKEKATCDVADITVTT